MCTRRKPTPSSPHPGPLSRMSRYHLWVQLPRNLLNMPVSGVSSHIHIHPRASLYAWNGAFISSTNTFFTVCLTVTFFARSTHILIFSQLEDCFNCNNEAYFAYKQMHNEAKGMLTPVLARSTLLLNAMARCKWSLHKQTAYVTREP